MRVGEAPGELGLEDEVLAAVAREHAARDLVVGLAGGRRAQRVPLGEGGRRRRSSALHRGEAFAGGRDPVSLGQRRWWRQRR